MAGLVVYRQQGRQIHEIETCRFIMADLAVGYFKKVREEQAAFVLGGHSVAGGAKAAPVVKLQTRGDTGRRPVRDWRWSFEVVEQVIAGQ